jgi:hypothetical protein
MEPFQISFKHTGNFRKTLSFLENARLKSSDLGRELDFEKYGRLGVEALRNATPKRTGKTAASWNFEVTRKGHTVSLWWTNDNFGEEDGHKVPVVILLQYGHMSKGGRYFIQGIDFINPALKPVFEQIAEDAWKEVTGRGTSQDKHEH